MKILSLVLDALQSAMIVAFITFWSMALGLTYVFKVLGQAINSRQSRKTYSGSLILPVEAGLIRADNGLSSPKL